MCVRVRESPERDEAATDSDSPAPSKCFMADGAGAAFGRMEGRGKRSEKIRRLFR